MASAGNTPILLPKSSQEDEINELISTLPREEGAIGYRLYNYQGFWFLDEHIKGVVSCQKHFQAQDSDIFFVTTPKSGTTWLKAIMFTLLNRKQYPVVENENHNHPLLTRNPHELVPFLEIQLYAHNQIPDIASFPSPRLFATHLPYLCLPESVKNSSACKLVYLCRNVKDTFVSLWHFENKIRPQETGTVPVGEVLEIYSKGLTAFGPFWDHVLEYWKQSKENPQRVLFLTYEDMKEQPVIHLRRLAEFLDCPFSEDEEKSGLVDEILKLCSFDYLSSLEINKTGIVSFGLENKTFYRRGEIGDWKNHLDAQMIEKLDRIMEEKIRGSGLEI